MRVLRHSSRHASCRQLHTCIWPQRQQGLVQERAHPSSIATRTISLASRSTSGSSAHVSNSSILPGCSGARRTQLGAVECLESGKPPGLGYPKPLHQCRPCVTHFPHDALPAIPPPSGSCQSDPRRHHQTAQTLPLVVHSPRRAPAPSSRPPAARRAAPALPPCPASSAWWWWCCAGQTAPAAGGQRPTRCRPAQPRPP